MDKIISCEFNIDTACVEVKYQDGSMISIDCTKVEYEVARNMYEASELDWLVYNAPVDYVNLLLHGDIREYLKNVTEYTLVGNEVAVTLPHILDKDCFEYMKYVFCQLAVFAESMIVYVLQMKNTNLVLEMNNQPWVIQFNEVHDETLLYRG